MRARGGKRSGTVAFLLLPLLASLWISVKRLVPVNLEATALSLVLAVAGAAVLWRLTWVAEAGTDRGGGTVAAVAILIALFLGFAPVALLGGSSTSMMLCLGVVAGLIASLGCELVFPRKDFGLAAIFGAGLGFMAMVDW